MKVLNSWCLSSGNMLIHLLYVWSCNSNTTKPIFSALDWKVYFPFKFHISPIFITSQFSLYILFFKNIFPFTGHGIITANSSIPSKYQTVVISNSDKKGFGGTSKRFNYDANVVMIINNFRSLHIFMLYAVESSSEMSDSVIILTFIQQRLEKNNCMFQ